MLRMLALVLWLGLLIPAAMRSEPGAVAAPSQVPDAAAARTNGPLQPDAAKISIDRVELHPGRIDADVTLENLTGLRLPPASPPCRLWLHVTVRDRYGLPVFESGALRDSGAVQGNDGDLDTNRVEPHYTRITSADQVQIYESVVAVAGGALTMGPLSEGRDMKDNRLLPRGPSTTTTDKDIRVHGAAENDPDFIGGRDIVRYSVSVLDALAPFEITAELWYQPMSSRSPAGAGVMLVRATAAAQ